jgi:hypothetical protein
MRHLLIFVLFSFLTSKGSAQTLYEGFENPPIEARPQVWWHWLNGNITKEGIKKDLEWMKRAGIGGFQQFDMGSDFPKLVNHKVEYMTPEWKECFKLALTKADSLGLEAGIASAPGWSCLGGPWTDASHAMKKLTWRTVNVEGRGKTLHIQLPQPYNVAGPFLNAPLTDRLSAGMSKGLNYYKDIAVVAVRTPIEDRAIEFHNVKITSSAGVLPFETIMDDDLTSKVELPVNHAGKYSWIEFEFPKPQTISSLSIDDGKTRTPFGLQTIRTGKRLEMSSDGKSWTRVVDIMDGGAPLYTISFPTVKAKYFRLCWDNPAKGSSPLSKLYGGDKTTSIPVYELRLYPAVRINNAEEKAGFFTSSFDEFQAPSQETHHAPTMNDVVDLTDHVDQNGKLTWKAPKGHWIIYRFGQSLTGKMNHPAPQNATGLEVDKFDGKAVANYLNHYLDLYENAMGGKFPNCMKYVLVDSYEAGCATWTDRMESEFLSRRGYELRPWLPVLTGQIINSTQDSEHFLYDWRTTLAELISENMYGTVRKVAAERGLTACFESHENGRVYLADGMDVKKKADIPMAAYWCHAKDKPVIAGSTFAMGESDIMESASVAHLYGKKIVGVESLTCNVFEIPAYSPSPKSLKAIVDKEFAAGANRIVIHESAHQPLDGLKPGIGIPWCGQWFNRLETWAEKARPWIDYIARNSYMLQQGKPVVDVAYYYGGDNNVTSLFGGGRPSLPSDIAFDYVNDDALLHVLQPKNGLMETTSGMKYRLLVIDNNAKLMSLDVLKKINLLAREGVPICGAIPQEEPTMHEDKLEFDRLVKETFYGQLPNVYPQKSAAEVLKMIHFAPDLKSADMSGVEFVHRKTDHEDIYWLCNESDSDKSEDFAFKVAGRTSQVWLPENGRRWLVHSKTEGQYTTIHLNLAAHQVMFVVFTDEQVILPYENVIPNDTIVLNHPWQVNFENTRTTVVMDTLTSWTNHDDPDIKYYSGTASYTQTFTMGGKHKIKGKRIFLSLGEVDELATIFVNDREIGTLWHSPYKLDITGAVKPGKNLLRVDVVNQWTNRLIGDLLPQLKPSTQQLYPYLKSNSTLLPAGLLGPVRLILGVQKE